MGLSVLIATFGLAANSTAVIIGAMLVAPLMTPILAYSAAMVMGWPNRQIVSFVIVIAGSLGAIGLALGVALVIPALAVEPLPAEVLARTTPNLLDLGIAIAAGAAGAYVTVRTKGLGSLPGVAIAVALVPPLSVVGVTLAAREYDLAQGAALLWFTNLAAIILAASVVFMLTGFVPRRRVELRQRRVQVGFAIAACVVIGVAFPLAKHSQTNFQEAQNEQQLSNAVIDWIAERDLRLANIELNRSGSELDITIDLIGPDQPPPTDTLADAVANATGRAANVTVGWVQEQRTVHRSEPGSALGAP
jgi:uncharacterized hydrophobic protein (TIGR00271 family)